MHQLHRTGCLADANRIVTMMAFSTLVCSTACVWPWIYIAGVVLQAVVIQVPRHAVCVTTTVTLSTTYGVLPGGAHDSASAVDALGAAGNDGAGTGVPVVTTATVTSALCSIALVDAGRPRCHV